MLEEGIERRKEQSDEDSKAHGAERKARATAGRGQSWQY